MKKRYIAVAIIALVLMCMIWFLLTVKIHGKRHFRYAKEFCLSFCDLEDGESEKIAELKKLKSIRINRTNMTDISFFEDLEHIEDVYFGGIGEYVDFSILKSCKNLQEFCGSDFGITDLSDFQEVVSLKTFTILQISESKITDISDVKYLINLEEFSVPGMNISDISALKSCQKLKRVTITGMNTDTDCSVFLELPELEYLRVDEGVLPEDVKEKLLEKGVEVVEDKVKED